MKTKRQKSRLEQIAEALNVEALRLRVEYPTKKASQREALKGLILCRDALLAEMDDLKGRVDK